MRRYILFGISIPLIYVSYNKYKIEKKKNEITKYRNQLEDMCYNKHMYMYRHGYFDNDEYEEACWRLHLSDEELYEELNNDTDDD